MHWLGKLQLGVSISASGSLQGHSVTKLKLGNEGKT
jgi:hypothetical protein